MKINSISFGKTIKVIGPSHDARRVANAINYKKDDIEIVSPEVKNQAKKIFNDLDLGHAIAYSDNNNCSCYIFSGKESREFQKNLLNRARKVISANQMWPYYSKKSAKQIREAWGEFSGKTNELIKRTQENYALKIYPNAEKIEIIR